MRGEVVNSTESKRHLPPTVTIGIMLLMLASYVCGRLDGGVDISQIKVTPTVDPLGQHSTVIELPAQDQSDAKYYLDRICQWLPPDQQALVSIAATNATWVEYEIRFGAFDGSLDMAQELTIMACAVLEQDRDNGN